MQGTEDRYLTVDDAAARLSIKVTTARKWLREGKLKGVKLGGAGWRVAESEVQRLLSGEDRPS